MGAGWRYDGYVQIGRNNDEETQSNNVLRSKFMELTYAPDGGVALCGGYDPFGLASISPECADFLSVDGTNRSDVKQDIVELAFNGPVFALPAGDVQAATARCTSATDMRTAPIRSRKHSWTMASRIFRVSTPRWILWAATTTLSAYVEASFPLLRKTIAARSLDAVVGYRVSKYASAGSVDAYKAELLYQPVESVRLRGWRTRCTCPERVRVVPATARPRRGAGRARTRPLCGGQLGAHGPERCAGHRTLRGAGHSDRPAPDVLYDAIGAAGVTGGNPDLKPETAATSTVGVVLRPTFSSHWLDRFQVSIDWYRIKVEDAISTPPVAAAVTRCYDATFNPEFSVDNTYCGYFARDPVTGNIVDAKEIYRNIGALSTTGIDFQLDWKVDIGPGTFAANCSWPTSIRSAPRTGPGSRRMRKSARSAAQSAVLSPEWKWNLRADYAWSGFDIGAQWRFIDSMRDADPETDFDVPSRQYFDVFLGYGFDEGALAGLSLMPASKT